MTIFRIKRVLIQWVIAPPHCHSGVDGCQADHLYAWDPDVGLFDGFVVKRRPFTDPSQSLCEPNSLICDPCGEVREFFGVVTDPCVDVFVPQRCGYARGMLISTEQLWTPFELELRKHPLRPEQFHKQRSKSPAFKSPTGPSKWPGT